MCERYALESDMQFLEPRFKFAVSDLDVKPRYKIAPTQDVLTVTNNGERHAQFLRWGLVPFWAKDLKIGYRMINAKAETLAERSAFRNAFKKRRCLVIADGFFEWRKEGKEKIPTYIFLKSREPFASAGLWETWKSPEDEVVRSCTIVTTEPNSFVEPIHSRMPVMLSEEAETLWLDPMTEDPEVLQQLLVPYPPESMDSSPVSTMVNSPRNQGKEIIQLVAAQAC